MLAIVLSTLEAASWQITLGLSCAAIGLAGYGFVLGRHRPQAGGIVPAGPPSTTPEPSRQLDRQASSQLAALYDRCQDLMHYGWYPPRSIHDPPLEKEEVDAGRLKKVRSLDYDFHEWVRIERGEAKARVLTETLGPLTLYDAHTEAQVRAYIDRLKREIFRLMQES